MPALKELAVAGPPVVVSPGIVARLGPSIVAYAPAFRYAIITDSNVGPLFAEGVAEIHTRPGRDLDTLGTFDVRRSRPRLRPSRFSVR